MIFENKKRFIRHQYTIIELLVVLVIAGLLTGMTVSGIKGALARQGAAGAVRTLANKISLAQSFAVSKNRYVALLIPDRDNVNNNEFDPPDEPDAKYKIGVDYTGDWNNNSFYFTKNRMCYVDPPSGGTCKFDRWIDGYEWQTLPSKTVAFITSENLVENSTPSKVTDIIDPTVSTTSYTTATALIFKPSGALMRAENVVIRIFRAAYQPGVADNNLIWQGEENKNKGWKIVINGFTGRSRFYLGGEDSEQ